MLTRRRKIALLAALAAVLVSGMVFITGREKPEPSYQGKTLSEWIVGYPGFDDVEAKTLDVALRAMGTNAIPYLLEWIQYEPPLWKYKVDGFTAKFFGFTPFKRQLDFAAARTPYLETPFRVLGPDAKAAVPELTRLMNASTANHTAYRAAGALGHIGKAALPPIITLLTNNQTEKRCIAMRGVGSLGTNALPAVPILLGFLADKDEKVVEEAIFTLGQLQLQPDLVIPALTNFLGDARSRLQFNAAGALADFGPAASNALPTLEGLIRPSDPDARFYSMYVREIRRGMVTNIPPQ